MSPGPFVLTCPLMPPLPNQQLLVSVVLFHLYFAEFLQQSLISLQQYALTFASALEEQRRHNSKTTQWSSTVNSKNMIDKVKYQFILSFSLYTESVGIPSHPVSSSCHMYFNLKMPKNWLFASCLLATGNAMQHHPQHSLSNLHNLWNRQMWKTLVAHAHHVQILLP